MKLEDHLTEHGMSAGPVNKTPISYTILHEDVKNLHVIGTCGDCKYWGEHSFGTLNGIEVRGCKKLDIVQPPNQRFGSTPPKDFGCIHFKEKE